MPEPLSCGLIWGIPTRLIDQGLQWVMWLGTGVLLAALVLNWLRPGQRLNRWLFGWGLGLGALGAVLFAVHLVWLLGGNFAQTSLSYLLLQPAGNLLLLLLGLGVALLTAPNRKIQSLFGVGFIGGIIAYMRA
jgi:hypothetical protein